MEIVSSILLATLGVVLLAYLYATRRFKYWKQKGVSGPTPTPFFGNFKSVILQKISPGEYLHEMYKDANGEPVVGFFLMDKPALLLRDPEIVKHILVKDFSYFVNRHTQSSLTGDPLLARGLFQLRGQEWKQMRNNLTPVFTSGRLKKMFHLIIDCGNELRNHMKEMAKTGTQIEVKDLMGKTSTDVISTCAFGINSNCLSNPDAEFANLGRSIFKFTFLRSLEGMSIFFFPVLAEIGKFKFLPTEASNFLRKVFWDTLVAREESKTIRNDLIDQLIQLKNKGRITDDENPKQNKWAQHEYLQDKSFDFNGDDLMAQAGVFFLAGFETTSSTLAFTLYELALHPDVQSRVREEVNEVIAKHGGEVNYEGVQQMKYLEMVISETLRRYPTLSFLDRVCVKDYQIPGTNIIIEKGTPIFVPLLGLHFDPQYFPDPHKFDPERFSDEQKGSISPCTYMPFGEGPRICIGLRFALMTAKTQIANIITQTEVLPCAKTPIPIVFNPQGSLLALPEGGIPLIFKKI